MALFLLNKLDSINQNNTNELAVLTREFKGTILLELVGIDKSCIWFNNERNILVSNWFNHFFSDTLNLVQKMRYTNHQNYFRQVILFTICWNPQ